MSILRARASDPVCSTIQTIHDTAYGSAGDPGEAGRVTVPTGPGAAERARLDGHRGDTGKWFGVAACGATLYFAPHASLIPILESDTCTFQY